MWYIRDKRIPNSYPQMQEKIEAYNKIVKNGHDFSPEEACIIGAKGLMYFLFVWDSTIFLVFEKDG
jgi:hypothetical protein